MEEKTACVRRDRACRKAMEELSAQAEKLAADPDESVAAAARQMLTVIADLEE